MTDERVKTFYISNFPNPPFGYVWKLKRKEDEYLNEKYPDAPKKYVPGEWVLYLEDEDGSYGGGRTVSSLDDEVLLSTARYFIKDRMEWHRREVLKDGDPVHINFVGSDDS